MTLVSMAGTGWTCPGTAANNCTRSDVLNGGASYPPITVTVNVAANAGTPLRTRCRYPGAGRRASSIGNSTIITVPSLALGKTATQSSTLSGYYYAGPGSAIDGNTDGNFFDGSVAHTNLESSPWWQVDLGASATINSIVVWNRTDCCGSRLSDYWVFISNTPFSPTDTPATLQNRAGTFRSTRRPHLRPAPVFLSAVRWASMCGELSGSNYLSLAEVQVLGTIAASSNVALGKTATQSSTLSAYANTGPGGAIDGNTDGSFFDGSVTHTNFESSPWWQVDLGASATINSIVVWNRTDRCGDRLSDYWVFISSTPFSPTDTPATLQSRSGTWSTHQTTAPNPSATIATSGAQGRYVRVQLSGTNYLSLAEVQVLGTIAASSNVALGKTAAQSSTLGAYANTGPGGAIDGNTDGNFFDGSVTHTNFESSPWWQVDLGASATINSVVVWNRTDCCGSRLSDYWVFISNTPFGATDTPATLQNRAATLSSHQTSAPAPSTSIPFSSAQGRYVRVQLSGTNYLSLAEIQVIGTMAASSNVALGKTATQSSTLGAYANTGPGGAIDGNTDGSFFDGSVSHTNFESSPWWQVDLGASATINSVVVWNRTDCCGDRLSDYWVFISNTPFGATDTPGTLRNRAGTWSSHQTSAPNPSTSIGASAAGRYVRIQLSGINYLSLAEVQVVGTIP